MAAAVRITLSYLPAGANVHLHLVHRSLGRRELAHKRHFDRFGRFFAAPTSVLGQLSLSSFLDR